MILFIGFDRVEEKKYIFGEASCRRCEMKRRKIAIIVCLLLAAVLVFGTSPVYAQGQAGRDGRSPSTPKRVTQAEREAAAARNEAAGFNATVASGKGLDPNATPDYFGIANWANSPLPTVIGKTEVTSYFTFYFAEGTCRPNFDSYICIQNPGGVDADVTITYMKGDATTATARLMVPKNSRATVSPKDTLGVGDDAAHDFSAKVECTNGQSIVAERPMYFNYKPGEKDWTGGHDVVGTIAPASEYYFAEGTCRPGFDPWICIQNPGGTDAEVTITYMKGDGTADTEQLTVPKNSRATVEPRRKLGTGDDAAHDFSASVVCTNNQKIVAERPMYFNYKPGEKNWNGGHDAIGASALQTTYYFAEGTCRPNFDPYICIQNPSGTDAGVTITYMKGDGTITTDRLVVPKNSRATALPRTKLGTGDDPAHDFSTKVECTNGQNIVAERPMYFNYRPGEKDWTGGHDVVGALSSASTFYFAEGTCRPNFDPYICIQNPGLNNADVTITYMMGDGTTDTESLTVPNSARSTVQPRTKLGTGDDPAHDFSAKVECTNGQSIVAERPMYFDYKGMWNGGHDAVGFPFSASSTTVNDVVPGTGMKKFVDSLPGLGAANANNLGQYIPVAVPDKTTYPNCDYYEIELVQYTEQMHSDLPPTTLRGYRQVNGPDTAPHYLGPAIVAQKGTPVRIKFTNKLDTGAGGDLFIPVDTTVMGAGMGPLDMLGMPGMKEMYTQNRATIHLHGGFVPWISDGTPHQWTTPAGETTQYPKGVSVQYVPDMDGGAEPPGTLTFYYNNQQSARLMFYHDHSYGITRLNVYAGEAAPYILQDPVEQNLVNSGVIPTDQLPLVIQDKTFVPDDAQLAAEDPTWDKAKWGGKGSLWYPHVYMPNQNPADPGGMNAFGRWHYGPWFWPPTNNITHPPVLNPYAGPAAPWENATMPGTPTPSMAMEAFMDTPVVNGTAYPTMSVQPKSYRLRILNAADDRFWNLQLYQADPTVKAVDGRADTEVKMVPAVSTPGYPDTWPTDGREGGVPDPATAGPEFIQIGNEGGVLPAPVVIPNQPIDWNRDQTAFNFGNLTSHTLLLGPAERADVVVDFSQYAGKTLILYNDCPAPVPALDPRYDYYTGAPDMTDTGGSPTPQAGYGPNTRTIMQIKVAPTAMAPAFDLPRLEAAFASTATTDGAFKASQEPILIPSADYNSAYNGNFPADTYARINDTEKTFQTLGGTTVTVPFQRKAIQDEMGEAFDEYGRQSGFLGLELPNTSALNQNFLLYPFASPPTDVVTDNITSNYPQLNDGTQIWKITHNGVDTHVIHTHLFNVQFINRVAWDNRVASPDPNELGWKESFRVNPLEDTIVALRPYAPTQPFAVPDSIRPLDPTMPLGDTLPGGPLGFTDPNGEPVTITNELANFGWEYVWHCHLLAHEEMDMMHNMVFANANRAAPTAPPTLTPTINPGPTVKLDWTDSSTTETHFIVQRGATATGPWTTLTNMWSLDRGGTGAARTYTDTTVQAGTTYYYRAIASNVVGFLPTVPFAAPAVDFPTVSASATPVASGAVIIP